MEFRLLKAEDMPQAKRLWKEAFSDSDKFINWYFSNKILPDHSLGLFDGGLVSALHLVPFRIRVQGRALDCAFIVGAATSVARRGEGHMRALLLEALSLLKKRRIWMTYLYPFKHSFYERLGWTTYTYAHRIVATEAVRLRGTEVIETADYRTLAPLYNKMMRAYDGYVIRGEREWRWRMEELTVDGGKAAVLIKNDIACAYMLYDGTRAKAQAVETVYSDEEDIGALLAHILSQGHESVRYFVPAQGGSRSAKYGMARVVDAAGLLGAFGAEAFLGQVNITDNFAPWNNTRKSDVGYDMHVSELAKMVHKGFSLQNMQNCTSDRLYRHMCETFVRQNTCIFEAY